MQSALSTKFNLKSHFRLDSFASTDDAVSVGEESEETEEKRRAREEAEFAAHIEAHYKAEHNIVETLLMIEVEYRQYYELLKSQMTLQRSLINNLCDLTQRYMIARNIDPNCKCPQLYKIEPEEVIIDKYYNEYTQILYSNKVLHKAVRGLRPNFLKFRNHYKMLDKSMETPLMMGDTHHKSIGFFFELVDDIFQYFHSGALRFDDTAHLLDPLALQPLEDYKKLLEHSEEFEEYFQTGLIYCRCLQPKPVCPELKEDPSIQASLSEKKSRRCVPWLERSAAEQQNPLEPMPRLVRGSVHIPLLKIDSSVRIPPGGISNRHGELTQPMKSFETLGKEVFGQSPPLPPPVQPMGPLTGVHDDE